MRRMLTITAAALMATLMLFVPGASAVETDRVAETDAAQVDEVRPEKPKIRCRGAIALGGAPKVKCRWTESEHPDAAAYKIVRVGGGERTVVFRTGDTSVTRYTDKDVEFGVRYRYRVVVLNEEGERIQRSRWNKAIVVKPDVERLKMECGVVDTATDAITDLAPDAARHSILCQWRPAQSEAAVEYQLWRRIRGQHRELVATVGLDTLSHLDHVPGDTTKVVYAVLALDSDGEIVGRSGLSKIRFPITDDPA
ncbi:MAG: hypothetical protein AAF480_06645 [Actinomycetota bacterium]